MNKKQRDSAASAGFVKEFRASNSQCFMCKRIVKKIEEGKDLTETDDYHMSVCLPTFKGEQNNKSSADRMENAL